MSKPFFTNLWLVIPGKVRYNRKKDISKPVISGEFRCVSDEKIRTHTGREPADDRFWLYEKEMGVFTNEYRQ